MWFSLRFGVNIFMLICVLNGQYDPPAGYYNNASGLTGTALRNAVYEIINDHTWYPYTSGSTDTWDILDNADQDPDNSSNILDVYKKVFKNIQKSIQSLYEHIQYLEKLNETN